jgi:DNA repair protein RadC
MTDDTKYRPMMREIPASERPRERLHLYGEQALKVQELLAIVLRTGVEGESALALADRLLATHHGLAGLARLSVAQLMQEKGFGEAKAAELKAVLELGRRLAVEQPEVRPFIRTPQDVQNLVGPSMGYLDHEEVRVILLNTKNQVITQKVVYRGSVSAAQIRIAEVFKDAIQYNAPSIVLVHNHPSGDPAPSAEDVRVTRQVCQASTTLDIELLDHIVVTDRLFVSMKAQGLGFD